MAIYSNTQTSLLAFLQEKATKLSAELGTSIVVANFDAYTDLVNLPSGDILGLGDLSMQSDSEDALEVVTAILMVGTESDANNMRLTKLIDSLYEDLKAEQQIPLLDEQTGEETGLMVCFGQTIVLPVEKDLQNKILQGVSFMAGVALNR